MREHLEELFIAFIRGMTLLERDPASMKVEVVLKRLVLYFLSVMIMLWCFSLYSPTTETLCTASVVIALGSLVIFSLWNGFRTAGKKLTEIVENIRPPLI